MPPARDYPCQWCGERAASWQHRVKQSHGGPWDTFNCVPLCGSGTTGCHGFVEANLEWARSVRLSIPGSFMRGRYVGPDEHFRLHYNGEVWSGQDWVPQEGTPAHAHR